MSVSKDKTRYSLSEFRAQQELLRAYYIKYKRIMHDDIARFVTASRCVRKHPAVTQHYTLFP